MVRFGEADHPRITDGWLGTGILPHDTRSVYGRKACFPWLQVDQRVVRFGEADHPRITDGWLGTGILPHDTRLVYGTRGWAQRRPKCCLPPTPRPLRSASAPFRAYRRAIGTIFGLPFFATRPLPDALHLQTPVCKERRVGEGATSVMRRSRKPYLLHVGTRETMPKRSGEASLFE